MNSTRLKLWKVKLKAAHADKRQWARVYNRAEKAMLRIDREIDELEKKIAAAKQADECLTNLRGTHEY